MRSHSGGKTHAQCHDKAQTSSMSHSCENCHDILGRHAGRTVFHFVEKVKSRVEKKKPTKTNKQTIKEKTDKTKLDLDR